VHRLGARAVVSRRAEGARSLTDTGTQPVGSQLWIGGVARIERLLEVEDMLGLQRLAPVTGSPTLMEFLDP